MQVACPRCSTENEIDETEQAADGRVRMRCSNCNAKLLIKVNRPDLKLDSDIPETPDDADNDVGTASVRLAPLDELEIELGEDDEVRERDDWHVLVVHELEWKRIGDFRRALLGTPKFKRNPNKMQDVTSAFPYVIQELAPEGLAKLTALLEGAEARWETGSRDALLDTQGRLRVVEEVEVPSALEIAAPEDTDEVEVLPPDDADADLLVAGDDDGDAVLMAGDADDDGLLMAGDDEDDGLLVAGDDEDDGFLAGPDAGHDGPEDVLGVSGESVAAAEEPEVTQDTFVVDDDEEDDGSDAAAEALFGPAITQDKVPAISRKVRPPAEPVENLAPPEPPPAPSPPPPPPAAPRAQAPKPSPRKDGEITLSTLTTVGSSAEVLGYVSAIVMLTAGDLAGPAEAAVTGAMAQARSDVKEAALKLGAHAIAGVRTTTSSVAGSWMVLIEGTAVRLD